MTDPGQMWDRRFSEHPWPSEPDPLLVEMAGPLPAGRGLDLGSGPGRNSLWLAARGWDMTLLDASSVALAQAQARAEQDGLHIETVHSDVLEWRPRVPSYDLAIVANLHPGPEALATVLASAADALVDGGHLFVVGHDVTSLGRHGPPDPDRLLSVERLSQALPATVSVEILDRRSRQPDHTAAPGDETPDVAVFAWATRRAR
ncbi:MAG TPA: class I SAM-dependent methyltransferase [Acidimicrobiales bacterium]|nr:class I SAM-dependent methyltransferase [Acidimicrobiales bacterium]